MFDLIVYIDWSQPIFIILPAEIDDIETSTIDEYLINFKVEQMVEFWTVHYSFQFAETFWTQKTPWGKVFSKVQRESWDLEGVQNAVEGSEKPL